jgi:SEC-C motif-containing protein
MASNPCPCSSGLRYRECCQPFHRGEAEAPTPTALMRSRYSAFALKEVDYLWRTLHPLHPDRARPEEEVKRELRKSASSFKYTGLRILDAEGPDASGEARVLFHARLFEKGRDCSFLEASRFRQEGGGWRYLSGEPRSAPGQVPEGLRLGDSAS